MMQYDWKGTLDGFLRACARQFAQGWLRRAKAHGVPGCAPRVVLECDREPDPNCNDDPSRDSHGADGVEQTDLGEQVAVRVDVQAALRRLPEKTRRIVEMKYFDECIEREITEQLGTTVFAVKRRWYEPTSDCANGWRIMREK